MGGKQTQKNSQDQSVAGTKMFETFLFKYMYVREEK